MLKVNVMSCKTLFFAIKRTVTSRAPVKMYLYILVSLFCIYSFEGEKILLKVEINWDLETQHNKPCCF